MMHYCPICDKKVKRRNMRLVYGDEFGRQVIRAICKECMKKIVKERLKPCPLCKSDDLYVFRLCQGVICCQCGIKITGDGWFEKWNRREWRGSQIFI